MCISMQSKTQNFVMWLKCSCHTFLYNLGLITHLEMSSHNDIGSREWGMFRSSLQSKKKSQNQPDQPFKQVMSKIKHVRLYWYVKIIMQIRSAITTLAIFNNNFSIIFLQVITKSSILILNWLFADNYITIRSCQTVSCLKFI